MKNPPAGEMKPLMPAFGPAPLPPPTATKGETNMATKFQNSESVSQKITAILIGAGLMAYGIFFAVQGVGAFTA